MKLVPVKMIHVNHYISQKPPQTCHKQKYFKFTTLSTGKGNMESRAVVEDGNRCITSPPTDSTLIQCFPNMEKHSEESSNGCLMQPSWLPLLMDGPPRPMEVSSLWLPVTFFFIQMGDERFHRTVPLIHGHVSEALTEAVTQWKLLLQTKQKR